MSDAPAAKPGLAGGANWCRNQVRQRIRGSVLLELDAQIEDAKGKQAQLGEAKLLVGLPELRTEGAQISLLIVVFCAQIARKFRFSLQAHVVVVYWPPLTN